MSAENAVFNMQPLFTDADAEAVAHQVRIGFVGPGPKTKAFGEALAAFAGRSYGELTVSGTMALTVAAVAIGLKRGDEILVPAYGVVSTINGFGSYEFSPASRRYRPATRRHNGRGVGTPRDAGHPRRLLCQLFRRYRPGPRRH